MEGRGLCGLREFFRAELFFFLSYTDGYGAW